MRCLYILIINLFVIQNLGAQFLGPIPDQAPQGGTYSNVLLSSYIEDDLCYSIRLEPANYINALDGDPELDTEEYSDYRENMTLTMKLTYAGFSFGRSEADKLWVLDEQGNIVEFAQPLNDPFNLGEQLFFLNVKGNFDSYMAEVVYYNATLDKYFVIEDAFEYGSNRIFGDPLDPFIIDLAPISFAFSNEIVYVITVDPSYQGNQCLSVDLLDCNSNLIASDQFCYLLDDTGCPESLIVFQSDIDADMQSDFKARSYIESDAQIMSGRTIKFSASNSILLKEGFEVSLGSSFEITTVGCN